MLMLLSASGGMVMAAANDLIVMFLGLEILSIAVYVLAAMHLRRIESQEAGIKYFVLGAFCSAFFLYGIALVYGATGTTNLAGIAAFASPATFGTGVSADQLTGVGPPACCSPASPCCSSASGSRSPPSRSTRGRPTCTRGRPTPGRGVHGVGREGGRRSPGCCGCSSRPSAATRRLAAVRLRPRRRHAARRVDPRRRPDRREADARLLARSATPGSSSSACRPPRPRAPAARSSTWPPTRSWSPAPSAWSTVVSRTGDDATSLDDYRGLARRRPLLALAFTVFLLAQAGVPFTSGFFAKFEVLGRGVEAGSYWLAVDRHGRRR